MLVLPLDLADKPEVAYLVGAVMDEDVGGFQVAVDVAAGQDLSIASTYVSYDLDSSGFTNWGRGLELLFQVSPVAEL